MVLEDSVMEVWRTEILFRLPNVKPEELTEKKKLNSRTTQYLTLQKLWNFNRKEK